MKSKVEIRHLYKTYSSRHRGDVVALEDVSLTIDEKEFVTLVGPSGCGKSTLLKMIGGLVRPTNGAIYLDGEPIAAPSRGVGIVFQNAVLLPWRNVLDNVLLPIEILRLDMKAYRVSAYQLLELVGLRGFERQMPGELSGGMQQRVAICRALIFNPSVLLMDEPFGALDAMTREELAFELLRIWHEHKKTVVFVTHSITEAVMLADRVVVLTPHPGRVAATIEVRLSRPRTVEMEFSAAFKQHSDEIRDLIFANKQARVP